MKVLIIFNHIDVAQDMEDGREFLKCEYNKDGDSYRSPWSN